MANKRLSSADHDRPDEREDGGEPATATDTSLATSAAASWSTSSWGPGMICERHAAVVKEGQSRRQFLKGTGQLLTGAAASALLSSTLPACATQTLERSSIRGNQNTISASAPITEVDVRLVQALKQYAFAIKNNNKTERAEATRTLLEYGLTGMQLASISVTPWEADKWLLDNNKGVWLSSFKTDYSPARVINLSPIYDRKPFDGFIVNGVKRDSFFGIPIGNIELLFLGPEKEPYGFSTHNLPTPAFNYNLGGIRERREVVVIPHNWLDIYGKNSVSTLNWLNGAEREYTTQKFLESLVMYEVSHLKHRKGGAFLKEQLAALVSLGYPIDVDIKTEKDVINYLQKVPLTKSKVGELTLKNVVLFPDFQSYLGDTVYAQATRKIGIELIKASEQINELAQRIPGLKYIPERDLLKASAQQIWAISRLLYNRLLEKHPELRP